MPPQRSVRRGTTRRARARAKACGHCQGLPPRPLSRCRCSAWTRGRSGLGLIGHPQRRWAGSANGVPAARAASVGRCSLSGVVARRSASACQRRLGPGSGARRIAERGAAARRPIPATCVTRHTSIAAPGRAARQPRKPARRRGLRNVDAQRLAAMAGLEDRPDIASPSSVTPLATSLVPGRKAAASSAA